MYLNRVARLTRGHLLTLGVSTSLLLTGCGDSIETKSDFTPPDLRTISEDWSLVWSDEFDGTELDMSKWSFEINCSGGGNNEEQCYTDSPENLFIEDGILNIVARPTEPGSGLSKPYTSSRIVTKDKAAFTYGRIEIRAKSPKGQGTFAAGWMMPNDSVYGGWPHSGEIDIIEWVNIGEVRADGDVDNHIHGTLHYGPNTSNHDYSGNEYALPAGKGPADQFYTYAVEWEEGEIRWYVDDVLFAYQRDSDVTYRAIDGEANGLSTKGWYTVDANTDELLYTSAPFDQDFFIILNNAVGGDWAGNVNQAFDYVVGDDKGTVAKGVDHSAYANGNAMLVDYVRVYQCSKDPVTGKGCATINSDYYNGTYVRGAAPVPIPPVLPVPVGVNLFEGSDSSWDFFSESGTITDLADDLFDEVATFTSSDTSTELGFSGVAYDGTLLPDDAKIEFDLNIVAINSGSASQWQLIVESSSVNADTQETETQVTSLTLGNNLDGVVPEVGTWQHYLFNLGDFRALGLDSANITAIKFSNLDGEFQLDNLTIGAAFEGAKLTLFEDDANQNWPMWDSRVANGESDVLPMVVADEDDTYGNTAEFYIAGNAVVGFNVREDQGGSGYPFDGSSLSQSGVIEFDLKVIDLPSNPNAPWFVKIESNGGTALGGTAKDIRLTDPPIQGQWVHYKLPIKALVEDGFDVSAIDVVLVFPAWGQGDGARFRLDNFKIHSSGPIDNGPDVPKGPDNTIYDRVYTVYEDALHSAWRLWDCCAFLPQTETTDDDEHGAVAEFTIGQGSDGGTVVGFFGRDTGGVVDVAEYINEGVFKFDMKVVTMPDDGETSWLIKLESAGGGTAAELEVTESKQGEEPRLGEWQSYSFPLFELASAGLDLSAIDIIMVFPAWSTGTGAVYRIDNAFFGIPSDDDVIDDISNQTGNGEELVNNGMFDSADGWGGTDGMADSIANGIFTADVATAGNPWDVSLKQNLTLVPDRTYVVTFDARSDDAREIIVGLGLDHDPWTNSVETVGLTGEWLTYTLTITTTGFGDDNSRLLFDLGAAVGEVQLDNVSVELVGEAPTAPSADGELVQNGGFDSSANWGGTDGMAASINDGIFSANVGAAGNPWDVSLNQGLSLIPDTAYTLSFDARSSDLREIIAGIGLNHEPWTSVNETVTLTDSWATYTLTLTTTGFGDDNSRVLFDLGAAVGAVQLDNVSLMPVGGQDNSDESDNGGEQSNIDTTPGVELLTNGDFSAADNWGGTDGMAASISNGIFSADVGAAGNPWDVSLKQAIPLVADTTYTVSFDARSDDSRDLVVGIGLDFSPWTNMAETVSLSSDWTTYTLTLTTTGFGDENSRVFFDMGAAAGQVQLDNVSVMIAE